MDDEELISLAQRWVEILYRAKGELLEVFEDQGLDSAYFDVNINLRIEVDGVVSQVKEKWKAME
jgi:hypothetical protein